VAEVLEGVEVEVWVAAFPEVLVVNVSVQTVDIKRFIN
jgi:hypothetical protein